MRESWLKRNRRVYVGMMVLPTLIAILSFILAVRGVYVANWISAISSGVATAVSVWVVWRFFTMMMTPRVAYEDGHLLIIFRRREIARVPIEIVEVFFLGSGPALSNDPSAEGPRTANVVVRLAESATEWHNGDFPPSLGKWYDGYIILRGTWCEPIGHERLNQFNHRLAEVRRQRRNANEQPSEVNA